MSRLPFGMVSFFDFKWSKIVGKKIKILRISRTEKPTNWIIPKSLNYGMWLHVREKAFPIITNLSIKSSSNALTPFSNCDLNRMKNFSLSHIRHGKSRPLFPYFSENNKFFTWLLFSTESQKIMFVVNNNIQNNIVLFIKPYSLFCMFVGGGFESDFKISLRFYFVLILSVA